MYAHVFLLKSEPLGLCAPNARGTRRAGTERAGVCGGCVAGADGRGEARAVRRGQRPAGPRGAARPGGALPQPLPPLPARQPLPVQVPLQLAPERTTP